MHKSQFRNTKLQKGKSYVTFQYIPNFTMPGTKDNKMGNARKRIQAPSVNDDQ